MTFKFPAEHKLDVIEGDKVIYDVGELLVHHHDSEGNKAILSIMITNDGLDDNKFID